MAAKSFETTLKENRLIKLRIFVACPPNMSIERARLLVVVEDLTALAAPVGVVLELIDWRQVVSWTWDARKRLFSTS
jgi:hypothetical protein